MNDLSQLLRMPMKTIETIMLVSWFRTVLTKCQRSVIVLCKNDNAGRRDLTSVLRKPLEA